MIDLLLFAFFWLGHACTWLVLLNMMYSQPWHKELLKLIRLLVGLLIFFGPPIFVLSFPGSFSSLLIGFAEDFSYIPMVLYISICFFVSMIALPTITIYRLIRQPPAVVLNETTETFDLIKELGSRPIGDGKNHHIAAKSINQLFTVDFTTLTLAVPGLPQAWDGLVILHLSDLHFIGTPAKSYYQWIINKCMNDGVPDLLMITGDVIDTNQHIRWIIPLLGKLRWNIAAFAILGNHDWWRDHPKVRRRLRRLKIHDVGNCWETMDVHGEKLIVIGHEGPWFRPAPDLKDCPTEGFRICLSHTPDNIRWCRRHGVRLMLSGHNHGGQIRIPIFGSLFVPSIYSRRYDMGTFHKGDTILHVNRGLSGKEPIRFRCNPQVTRIVLRQENTGNESAERT